MGMQEFRIVIEPAEANPARFVWTLLWSGAPLGFGVRESRVDFATRAAARLAAELAARRLLRARFVTATAEAYTYDPTQAEVDATT